MLRRPHALAHSLDERQCFTHDSHALSRSGFQTTYLTTRTTHHPTFDDLGCFCETRPHLLSLLVRFLSHQTAAPQQAAASSSAPVSEPAQPQAAVPAPQQIAPAAAPVDGSFDFQNSNARFEKLDDAAAAAASAAVPSYDLPAADAGLDVSGFPVVTKKYDKSKSFFDELTTDKGTRSAASGRDMRRVDVDTFGSEAQNFRSKHGRGGRGPRGPRGPRGGQQPQQGGQQQQGGAWRQNPQ